MRLTIVTFGSEGDTRPLAALSRGLLDRGHQLTLFADHSTLGLPRQLGIPSEALPGDVKAILPSAGPHQPLRMAEILKTTRGLPAIIKEQTAAWLKIVAPQARESDAILFSSLAVGVGLALRDEMHKPGMGLFLQPITPTREFSSPMLPPMRLPGWATRLTYVPAHAHLWSVCAKVAQAARRDVFGTIATAKFPFDYPMLYGVSQALVPQPADWPSSHRVCGHWARPVDEWRPPEDLGEFLAAGEPPLYAGFGSPSGFIRKKALDELIKAVAGQRVVFSPGWSRIDSTVLPKNFFIARDVPHEWLFPRMSLAIHHGGAGTTHTAARAGIPQIILPFGGDQHFWAHRLALRGVAPKQSRGKRFKAERIAAMIEFAQRDDTRTNARALAEAMAREDGVGTAIGEIERFVKRR